MGNYVQAIESYNNATYIDQNNFENYKQLGDAYSSQGSYDEAASAYEKALQLDPGNAEVIEELRKLQGQPSS